MFKSLKKISLLLIFIISIAYGQYDSYYDAVTNLRGETLQSALHDIIKNHTVKSYPLWEQYPYTDKKANGKVWDMYSDIPDGTPPYEYTFVTDQCGNYSGEGSCFNNEHSFPKSWFNEVSPMNSDLFHLYPTDGYVNGRRSNYPYGEVTTASWTSHNGSKVGPNTYPGYSGTVFEPLDEYKGDFARTYFYMATRYYGEDAGWPGSDMVDGAQPKAWALAMLMDWADLDPVSQKELDRNDAVYAIQHNRNPFIDHPEFSDYIWDESTWVLPENFTIMTYNTENYFENSGDTERDADFLTILSDVQPDICMLEEIWEENNAFVNMETNIFDMIDPLYESLIIDQNDTWQDIGVFYRSDKFDIVGSQTINISSSNYLRDALEVKFLHKATQREFLAIGLHLKANSWTDNEDNLATRASQTDILRNYLNSLSDDLPFIVLGDFNMLNASEVGWQNLTESRTDNSGRCVDPTGQIGEWNNNSAFAAVHSHAADDLDTRFDFILVSNHFLSDTTFQYVTDSYEVIGNDGNHYSRSVNSFPNSSVSDMVANALVLASDHLPVMAEFTFDGTLADTIVTDSVVTTDILQLDFEDGSFGNWETINISSDKNWEINSSEGANYTSVSATINGYGADAPSNDWLISPGIDLSTYSDAELVLEFFVKSGYSGPELKVFISDDYHSGLTVSTANWTELKSVALNDFWAKNTVSISNYNSFSNAAIAFQYSSTGTGSGDAAKWSVDEIRVSAKVSIPLSISDITALPDYFTLYQNYPNPFNPVTQISFDITHADYYTLSVYSIKGQLIETALSTFFNSGRYSITFDGSHYSSGLYFYKLNSSSGQYQIRKMTLIK